MIIVTSSGINDLKNILPPKTFAILASKQKQDSTSPMVKYRQIDIVLRGLPQETIDKLPTPQAFQKLPTSAQEQARDIIFSKALNYNEKDFAIEKLPVRFYPYKGHR
uniref:Uncharacterized protein n=1 Tax=Acrobeloides nanus TaxID=290746 RepID=A0A914E5M1_9BILA